MKISSFAVLFLIISSYSVAAEKTPDARVVYASYCAEKSKDQFKTRKSLIQYCRCMTLSLFDKRTRADLDLMSDEERTSISMFAAQECSKFIDKK